MHICTWHVRTKNHSNVCHEDGAFTCKLVPRAFLCIGLSVRLNHLHTRAIFQEFPGFTMIDVVAHTPRITHRSYQIRAHVRFFFGGIQSECISSDVIASSMGEFIAYFSILIIFEEAELSIIYGRRKTKCLFPK